jgi:hypothetical protein
MRGPYMRLSDITHDAAIIVQRKKRSIDYLTWDTMEEFYAHYHRLHPSQRIYNEVIQNGHQKFRLDIDDRTDNIDDVIDAVKNVFYRITNVKIKIRVYDIKKSYHIVISNVMFENSGCCHMVANLVLDLLPPNSCIDIGVYKTIQMFRMEGSTKYLQARWKYRIGKQSLSSISKFQESVISYTNGCKMVNTDRLVEFALESGVYKMYYNTFNGNNSIITPVIPDEFVIREVKGHMTVLDRIRPSYCNTCHRIHESENAYLIGSKLYCRRF